MKPIPGVSSCGRALWHGSFLPKNAAQKSIVAGRRGGSRKSEHQGTGSAYPKWSYCYAVHKEVDHDGFIHDQIQGALKMRFKIIGLCLAAVFVMSAVVATAAQAEEAPFWSRGGSGARLGKGETRDISAKISSSSFVLKSSGGETITCHGIRLKEGVLLGSEPGEPGTNDEVVEFFKECGVTGDGTGCTIEEPIVTENLKSELVYAENKKQVLEEFKPAVSGGRLATLHFGSTCTPVKGAVAVEGTVAAEVLNGKSEKIELPTHPAEEATGFVKFPETAIRKVWLIKGGVGEEAAIGIKVATLAATLTGTALVLLANSKGESTGELFSALP
jgi:hypothetical protein